MAYIGKRPVDTFPAINAVTSTLIAENNITAREIATNTVVTSLIADNAVTAVKIAENSITSRELAANTIATGNIADNAVDGTKIAQNSILTRHIDDGQVTTDQLGADAVTAAKLADDAVVTANIVDANVTTAKIATNAVTSVKIAQNSILTKHIDDAQVGSDQLTTDAVTTVKITDANVTAAKLASDSVTTAKITDANVTTVKIADSNITTAKVADDAITLAKMAGLARGKIIYGDSSGNPAALALGSNGQVLTSDGTDISWGTDAVLSTENVQDITGAMFSSNTETGISATYEDGDGTIDLVIGDNSISASMIAENVITSRELAANTIATGNIADNAVDGTKIAQNSILTRHIDDGQVTTSQLGADAVTGAKIADDAIDSEHYTDGSIDTAHIADDAVTAAKLANTAVTAASYGSGSAIPVITVDAQGRITAASTAATSSTLTIAADSGSNDTVTVGTDTLTFEGTANEIETTVSNNKINIGLPTNVTIAGNLTVSGTTTEVSSTTINVADPLVSLATSNNSSDAVDIGIYGLYDTSGSQDLYSGLFRDASDSGKWKLFKDTQAAPTTTVNTGGTGYATATLVANIEGNVTGNVTGNTSGTAATVTGAAQSAITSLGTLTTLTVDNLTVNGNTITADSGALNLTPASGSAIVLDGTINVDAGVVTGATSITSTAFVGNLTGNVTGNTSGTAATVTSGTQAAITTAANLTTVGTIGTGVWQGTAIASNYIAADAITGAKIADDAIDSEHYTDGSIDTAHIADDQVTLAKMAGLARGKIIYGDSGGNPAALALGSNGQVLKSDGTDISWAADSGLSTEEVQDIVGGMVTGNTETGIAVTYEDGDGTLDFIIGSGAVASSMIAADAVTQAKIADDAVGADQLAANSVVSASIVNGSIVSADIADNTIATSNIADNAVDATKIASNSILTRHIDDNQITGDQLADDLVLSGTGAIRMPDGTTGQRPGSPAAGMFRYNTTLGKFEGYTSAWGEIGGGTSAWSSDTMTGDGSDTTLTLSAAPNSEADVIVFIDGVFQNQDSYSISGTTLTFDTAPVSGRYVRAYTVKQAISGTNLTHNTYSGDGSDTTFTLSIAPVHENNTQVYIDGVYQHKTTYSISGTTLTFSSAPPNGTTIEVMTMNQLDINVPVDDSITTAKIADNAITSAKIAAGAVVVADIADNSITAAKIPNATALTLDGGVTVDNITIDGTEIDLSSGDLTLDVAGDIILDADGGDIKFKDGGTSIASLKNSGGTFIIKAEASDGDIYFNGNDGGSAITAMAIDMSAGGNVGIGTTSPATLLELSANTSSEQNTLRFTDEDAGIVADQNIGKIEFYSNDASGAGGSVRGYILCAAEDTSPSTYLAFATNPSAEVTGGIERMRIDASGNVEVKGGQELKVYRTDNASYGSMKYLTGSGGLQFNDQNSDGISFVRGGSTESMRLDSSGRLLVGATSGSQRLLVSEDANDNTILKVRNSGNSTPYGQIIEFSGAAPDDNTRYFLRCGDTGANRMHIYSDGDVNTSDAGTLTSDRSLKTDIEDATLKLADINQLQVRNFKWITDYHPNKQNKHIGFIADEFETVFPSLVVEHENPIVGQDGTVKSVRYGALIPILVKALQELSTELDAAKARITTLEG